MELAQCLWLQKVTVIAISITATAPPTNRLQCAWGPLGFGEDRTMIRSNRQAVCSFCRGTIDLVGEKNKVHEALRAAGRTAMMASSSSIAFWHLPWGCNSLKT
jgi:hypothetical protein